MYGEAKISFECSPGQDAQCDGTDCDCLCHGHSLPRTTKGVRRWHDLGYLIEALPGAAYPVYSHYPRA